MKIRIDLNREEFLKYDFFVLYSPDILSNKKREAVNYITTGSKEFDNLS